MKIENVEQFGICSQCGICQLVCSNIKMVDNNIASNTTISSKEMDYCIKTLNPKICLTCKSKQCLQVCPSYEKVLSEPVKIEKFFAGHSNSNTILESAASGGFITTFLKYLLDTNTFNAVIVVVQDTNNPQKGKYELIEDSSKLITAASSIYSMVPLQTEMTKIIKKIENKKVVFVGRPCQIKAIKSAKKINSGLNNIALTISLFCAWSISQRGVNFLLQMSGIKKKNNIENINYRNGKWPGNFIVESEGRMHSLPFSNNKHYRGLYYFPLLTQFVPSECKRCIDVLGSSADISVGDAWNLNLDSGGKGYSLVIVRDKIALGLLNDSNFFDEYFTLDKECNLEDIEQSQGNTIKIKRSGVLLDTSETFFEDITVKLFSGMNKILYIIMKYFKNSTILTPILKIYLKIFWIGKKNRR